MAQKELTKFIEEEKKNVETQAVIREAESGMNTAENEMERLYAEYNRYAEAGNFKMANSSLNMFLLVQKIHGFATQYVSLLKSQKAIYGMLDMISKTNSLFEKVMAGVQSGNERNIFKGLKKMKKSMKKMSVGMDRMTVAMSSVFDEKTKKKRTTLSDEDIFKQSLDRHSAAVNSYAKAHLGDEKSPDTASHFSTFTSGFSGVEDPT